MTRTRDFFLRIEQDTDSRMDESSYRDLLLSIHGIVVQLDQDARIRFLNPAWTDQLGHPLEDVLERTLFDFIPMEYHLSLEQLLDSAHAGTLREQTWEAPLFHQDGSSSWFEAFFRVHGKYLIAVLHNIDARVQAENLLRANEARFRAVVNSATEAIITIDHLGRILEFNPAAERIFGYERTNVLGKSLADHLIPVGSRAAFREKFARYLATGKSMVFNRLLELEAIRSDGTEFPVEATITRISTEGPPLFTAFLRDITEVRRNSESLRRSEAQARKLALVASRTENGVIIADRNGGIEWVNAAFTNLTGYRLDDVLGKTPGSFLFGPESSPTTVQYVAEQMRKAEGFQVEILQYKRSGETYWSSTETQPIFDDAGKLTNFITIESDISVRKQAEAQLQSAKDAAEAANLAKSQFLANMSHEVRTPMTAILGYLDVLMDASLPAEIRRGHLHAIRRNANHLLQIINDILDLSKIEAGKLELVLDQFSPWQLALEATSLLSPSAMERNIVVQTRAGSRIPAFIKTDATRLRQILLNLISNAIKYTDAGKSVTVTLSTREDGPNSFLDFEVRDEGIGIAATDLDRLFQPFAQVDSSSTRRYGGTGLGLNICRRLADLVRANITVTSEIGKGSCFVVHHPLEVSPSTIWKLPRELQSTCLSTETMHDVEPRPSCRVLLAEDNPDNQKIVCYFLSQAGIQVDVVENGRLAVEAALGKKHDVILMDMQMPELDGYDATAQLRAAGCTIPIIALTAHAMRGDRDECLKAGCTDYLTKPVDARALLRTLQKYVGCTIEKAPADESKASTPRRANADPELAALTKEYMDALLGQKAQLRAAFIDRQMERLRSLAHQMKGASSMYGFTELSEAAGLLEQALREGQEVELIGELLQEVEYAIQSIHDMPSDHSG